MTISPSGSTAAIGTTSARRAPAAHALAARGLVALGPRELVDVDQLLERSRRGRVEPHAAAAHGPLASGREDRRRARTRQRTTAPTAAAPGLIVDCSRSSISAAGAPSTITASEKFTRHGNGETSSHA